MTAVTNLAQAAASPSHIAPSRQETPAAASSGQYVFYADANFNVQEAYYSEGAWRGPIDICKDVGWGCHVNSTVSVDLDSNGNQYVYYKGGPAGQLGPIYQASFDVETGKWSGPTNMCQTYNWGCNVGSGPDVGINRSNNRRYVFFVGGNYDMYEAYRTANGWVGSINMCDRYGWGCDITGGPVDQPPAVAVQSNGDADVFWSQNHIHEAFFDAVTGTGWHGPYDLCADEDWGCSLSAGPDAGVTDTGTQYVFYPDADSDINEAYYSGSWHDVGDLCSKSGWGCSTSGGPGVGVDRRNGNQYVFYINSDFNIEEAFYEPPPYYWQGPIDLCKSSVHWGCDAALGPGVTIAH